MQRFLLPEARLPWPVKAALDGFLRQAEAVPAQILLWARHPFVPVHDALVSYKFRTVNGHFAGPVLAQPQQVPRHADAQARVMLFPVPTVGVGYDTTANPALFLVADLGHVGRFRAGIRRSFLAGRRRQANAVPREKFFGPGVDFYLSFRLQERR